MTCLFFKKNCSFIMTKIQGMNIRYIMLTLYVTYYNIMFYTINYWKLKLSQTSNKHSLNWSNEYGWRRNPKNYLLFDNILWFIGIMSFVLKHLWAHKEHDNLILLLLIPKPSSISCMYTIVLHFKTDLVYFSWFIIHDYYNWYCLATHDQLIMISIVVWKKVHV